MLTAGLFSAYKRIESRKKRYIKKKEKEKEKKTKRKK
jgi:hypothetical protein